VVTNHAAGISGKKLTTVEVIKKMEESNEKIKHLLKEIFPLIPGKRECPCKDALKDTKME